MGEILSHAEVETLLSAIKPTPPRAGSALVDRPQLTESPAWEPHDFHRPEPLHGDLLKILQTLHAGLCQRLQVRLGSLLRTAVKVCPVGLSNTTHDEFASGLEPSSLICCVTPSTPPGAWLLTWQSTLAFSLIDTLLGGTGSHWTKSTDASTTEIELRLLTRIGDAVLDELQALAGSAEPRHVAMIHSNSAEALSGVANVAVLCLSFEIACSGERGLMHFCMPRLLPDWRSLQHAADRSVCNEIQPISRLAHEARRVGVELSAHLARLRLRANDVAGLAIGDVLMTDVVHQEDVTLRLADQPLFRVAIGTLLGKKAVRITSLLAQETSDEKPC